MTTPASQNRSGDLAEAVHERLGEAILSAELRPHHRFRPVAPSTVSAELRTTTG